MKFKKTWKDRQGAAPIVIIAVILVIIAIVAVAFAAYILLPDLTDGRAEEEQSDQDRDGDGVADPYIGYLDISVAVTMISGGSLIFDDSDIRIGGMTVDLVEDKPSNDGEATLWAWQTTEKLTLKFKIAAPQSGLDPIYTEKSFQQRTPGGASITTDYWSPPLVIKMRYHTTVQIQADLYMTGSNELLDSMVKSFQV